MTKLMFPKILFVCGSLNQTSQMHAIAREFMDDAHCRFSPYYADGLEQTLANLGLLNSTVLGGQHMRDTYDYLALHNLPLDIRGDGHKYDLVITCSDLIVQKNIEGKRIILIQEGITEPEGKLYHLQKMAPFLPRYIANTAASGLSDAYDIFCVASEGYRQHFIRKGVRSEKIAVTGIPNFDNLSRHLQNDFPYHDYALVATTPYRETLRSDNRLQFLRRCVELANGRALIFKLHPTENIQRASREIRRIAPHAQIFTRGNINDMIANAGLVITQQSTCTFVALALGKETHTYLDKNELQALMPIQNGGISAHYIAGIARRLLQTPMSVVQQMRQGYTVRPRWEIEPI